MSNPKDLIGATKLPLHLWPPSATALGCMGMLEGAGKYGRGNYRAEPVFASIYYAALLRHVADWFEGADLSDDSGNPHLGNALATLAIIVDAQTHGTLIDDRNFQPGEGGGYQRLIAGLLPQVAHLKQLHAEKDPKQWTAADNKAPALKVVAKVKR